MKHVLLLFSFLIFSLFSTAQDYYWVGGSGDWSDFSNHWATATGGITFHTAAPTISDSVYFDANSFTAADQELTVDVESYCANMDWAGATNTPTWAFSSETLHIGGSLTLIPDMEMSHRNIYFDSDDLGNTLTVANKELTSLDLRFYGLGSWELQDTLRISEISTYDDTLLDFNDQYAEVRSIYPLGSSVVDLTSSEVFTVNFRSSSSATEPVIGGTSKLYVDNSFYAGGASYNWVVLETPLISQVSLQDDATMDTLEIATGTTVSLESGTTLTVNQLIATGTKAENITIFASTAASAATISRASGVVNAEYLVMQDITAAGGATFNATNTIDNGNNTGWTITGLTGANYFWVGGSGSWSEFSTHWATASGGTTMHTDVPGQLDSMFFDVNSFAEAATITLDISAACANMDWSAIDEAVDFSTTGAEETLSIYGSLILSEMVTLDLDDIYLYAADAGNVLITKNQSLGFNSKLWLSGAGSYTLTDSLDVRNLEIEAGSFDLNDQVVSIRSRFDVGGSETKSLDFGASDITTNDFYYTSSGLTLDAGTSTFRLSGNNANMRGNASGDIVFHKMVVDGDAEIDLYDHTFFSFEITAGSRLTIGEEDTLTMTHFIALGTLADSIEILSGSAGVQGVIEVASGTIDGSYLKLKDLDARGGATFNAFESNDEGNVTGWTFLDDETAPSFEIDFPKLDSIASLGAFFEVQVDEPATVYYIAVASGSSSPTASQVKAGTDSNDATAPVSGSEAIGEAEVITELIVSDLAEEVAYDFYFALEDDAENLQATVVKISATTIDTSAPQFSAGFPKTASVGAITFELAVALEEAGKAYFVVLDNEATAPSILQVIAGTDVVDAAATASGSIEVMEVSESFLSEVSGLTGETAYDVYFVAEDADGNSSMTAELLEVTTCPEPKDYYWAGGTGNWSEFATHWASTSGGATFHAGVPTINDQVFFDANSFSAAEQSVTIDEPATCKDMSWTEVTNIPTLEVSTSILTISGSLTLVEEMTMNHRSIYFESDDDGRVFKTANLHMEDLDIRLYGSGALQIEDSLFLSEISTYESSILDLNDQYAEVFSLYPLATSVVDLTSSQVHATNFRVSSSAEIPVIAGTSKLFIDNSFYAGEATFNVVSLAVPLGDQVFLQDDFTADSLVLAAGTSVNFESGTTITFNQLLVSGTKSDSISLDTSNPGSQVTLTQLSGEVNATYAILQDIEAIGGATFTADQSTDLGNNTGWTFLADETAPTFAESYPEIDSISSTSVRIKVQADEPVTLHYVVLASGATTPSATQVIAGTDASDATAIQSDTESLTVFDEEALVDITGLAIETTYELFFALEDGTGNIQTEVGQLTVTTTVDPEAREDQTITFTDDLSDLTYGDAAVSITAASSASLAISYTATGAIAITGAMVTITGAGEASVTAAQLGNDDFNPAVSVTQSFTIAQAALTVSADDQQITFGETISALTLSYSEFVGADAVTDLDIPPTASTLATETSNAGSYELLVSGGVDADYSFSYVSGTLTIAKAVQTITFEAIEEFDLATTSTVSLTAAASSELDVTYTLLSGDGQIAGDVLTANASGNFEVEATQAGNENYNASAASQTFQVIDSRKTDQTITFGTIEDQVYGDAVTLVATASSGLTVSFSLSSGGGTVENGVLTITNMGDYAVTASQDGDADFNPGADVVQAFSVSKAMLVATADDKTMQEGEALPQLTLSYSGFKLTDDATVLDTQPEVSTTATTGSSAGTYDITLTGGEDGAYDFSLVNGTLTIENVLGNVEGPVINIYPNPTQNKITVSGGQASSIELTDLRGRTVLTSVGQLQLDLSPLAAGTYVILIKNKKGEVVTKQTVIKN